ncbi:hypothetical protein [Kineosporia sp. NBRC 101677]|uniref:D-alanine--D-alanine ligase family protein n=1 Tax=Kineosporia sp. NBRC 101677 TaxID=3032197 RepID=UPI0025556901|nr:hypothetical protein [Kineosporia sp. NBRC 101677]
MLHLAGSATDEFTAELSLLYARDCLEATADPARYEFRAAYVDPAGSWRFGADFEPETLHAAPRTDWPQALQHLHDLNVDVVVPQMFCLPGMTTYRAALDLAGLPYLGNRPPVMSLGADKAHARAVVAAAGVDVPEAEVLRRGQRPTLPPPVVVKPVDGDNSLGVSLVQAPEAYGAALAAAFEHSERVLVEAYVELGREVRCAVLEREGELAGLPLEEYAVDPVHRPVRRHADKIGRGDAGGLQLLAKSSEEAWTVDLSDPVTARVHEAAFRAHTALGCRDYSLFDFRIDPSGRPWFLEAGLYCSFARQSVVVMMAEAAGIALPDLFAQMIAQRVPSA